MKILGVNAKYLLAMAQQSQAACPDGECPFAQMLKNAAGAYQKNGAAGAYKTADADTTDGTDSTTDGTGSTTGSNTTSTGTPSTTNTPNTSGTGKQVELKLNQAIAEAFIAPLLAQTAINIQQKYFLHSPAEQAYAKQMYTQIAGQIGTSGRMPLAKSIAKAVLQQMGQSDWPVQEAAAATADNVTT